MKNNLPESIQTWQNLLAAGQLDYALDGMLDYFREDPTHSVTVFQFRQRFSTLRNQDNKGLIHPVEYRQTVNQITAATLDFLTDLQLHAIVVTPAESKATPQQPSTVAPILVKTATRVPAPAPHRQLLADLAQKKVIPMIGAGLSIAAHIVGEGNNYMPDYYQLLARLLERVDDRGTVTAAEIGHLRALLEQGHTAEVAERMKQSLGSEYIFFQELRAILNPIDENVFGSQAHDLLRTMDFRHLITTNYDRLLEKFVCPRHEVITPFDPGAFRIFSQSLTERGRDGDKFLLKMHGDITRPETIPFGEEQLRGLYEDINVRSDEFREFLRSLFRNYTLLFLGFSFKSDSEGYVRFLRNLIRSLGGNTQTHYALVPLYTFESEAAHQYRQLVTQETGIVFIEYVPDEHHSQVWEFISFLNTSERDEPVIGRKWAQWYRPEQRADYLQRQLAIEQKARSVRYLTPKLTNAIATDAFLQAECRRELLQKVAYGDAESYARDVETMILPLMVRRRDNLYRRLQAGELEVRALFLKSELDREMQQPTANAQQRYLALLEMLDNSNLDLEVRLLDGLTKDDLTQGQATFALIYANLPKPNVDVSTAYASQANLDLFQLHMLEINTDAVQQKTFQFERYWASAWSEQQTKAYLRDVLAHLS